MLLSLGAQVSPCIAASTGFVISHIRTLRGLLRVNLSHLVRGNGTKVLSSPWALVGSPAQLQLDA